MARASGQRGSPRALLFEKWRSSYNTPMSQKLRIAITGSGFMGRTHAEAARRASNAEVVAVAGGSRSKTLAEDYQIAWEPSATSLFRRDDVDAVVITTPHHVHVEEALLAAEAKKHALVEKPLATSVTDCDRMIEAFRQRGLVLAVGYHQRFRKSNRRVRELLQTGVIGKVRCIQTTALFDIETMRNDNGFGGTWDWWTDPRSRAHILNSAPHNIDLCRWWLGVDIATVAAHCGNFREENPNENTTMALWMLTDGTMVSFWSSSVCPYPSFPGESFRFRLMGDGGIIDACPFGKIQLGTPKGMEVVFEQPDVAFDDPAQAFTSDGRMQAYTEQIEAFANRVQGGDSSCGTAEDGRAGVLAIEGMLDASAQSGTVRLPGS